MQVRHVRFVLMAVVAATCFIVVSGCNNNDGDGEQSTEIRGIVTQVVEAMNNTGAPSARFARLKEFFTLVRTAHAQTPGVAGIVVTVLLDGVTLDTDETDEAGNFVLNVAAGSLVLTFTAENFSVSLNLTVASNSSVTLEVSLHPSQATEVVIEAMETLQSNPEGLVFCEHGTLTIAAEQVNGTQSDIELDGGGGEVCMRTESGCRITTQEGMTANIIMSNCQQCIRAESESEISLITAGSIICDHAREDGVRAESGSRIELVAGHVMAVDGAMADAMPAAGATIAFWRRRTVFAPKGRAVPP